MHLLSANLKCLEKAFDPFVKESKIEIEKNTTIFDALKQLPGIEVHKVGNNQYITSINGEKGYYIYEINGEIPAKAVDKLKPKKNVTLELKKLITVNKKKIEIKIKNK